MAADSLPEVPPFVDDTGAVIAADRRAHWNGLRDLGPILDNGGVYLLTRRSDVLAALRNPRVFASDGAGTGFSVFGQPVATVQTSQPPDHTRFRRALQPFFGPRALGELQPRLQEQARELIDSAEGGCDAIPDILVPYGCVAAMLALGLKLVDRDRLAGLVGNILRACTSPGSASECELIGYLADAILGESPPRMALQLVDAGLTQDEVIAFYDGLIVRGQDSLIAAGGSVLLELARDPQLAALLRADPERIPAFIEEILRLEPPFPIANRILTEDVTVAGVTLPAGSRVHLCLASLDLEDGDEMGVQRSFGAGIHRCLGAALARMALAVLTEEWLRLIPEFALESGVPDMMVSRGGAVQPASLPLRW